MNSKRWMSRPCALGVIVGLSALLAGCATKPSAKLPPSYQLSDVEGRWSWTQDPWCGEFVLTKDGDSYTGTLNDVYEGTSGDRIVDIAIVGDHIRFTRKGQYGVQLWEGILKEENGVLKIVDGQWAKVGGAFTAEKKE